MYCRTEPRGSVTSSLLLLRKMFEMYGLYASIVFRYYLPVTVQHDTYYMF